MESKIRFSLVYNLNFNGIIVLLVLIPDSKNERKNEK